VWQRLAILDAGSTAKLESKEEDCKPMLSAKSTAFHELLGESTCHAGSLVAISRSQNCYSAGGLE
jgi:hypothetical protein